MNPVAFSLTATVIVTLLLSTTTSGTRVVFCLTWSFTVNALDVLFALNLESPR